MDARHAALHESLTMSRQDQNPFDLQKASNYSSQEILEHWVDIAGHGGLVSVLRPTAIIPMLVLGGKGSGKTHLMRYCSAPVQAARHGSLIEAIRQEHYAGIYVPAEALNTPKFSGKGQDTETWDSIFSTYFEAWLTNALLCVARDALGERFTAPVSEEFSKKLQDLFDIPVSLSTLDDLLTFLIDLRKHVDFVVNNSAITRDLSSLVIPFSTGKLLFGVPDLVAETFEELGNPLFVYLVDELENFTIEQQKFINTLIRYRKGRATIKVGARLYGIKTFSTLGSGEPIREGSEFEKIELDKFLREHSDAYKDFAVKLVLSRLQQCRLSPAVTDAQKLEDAFEQLDKSDYWRAISVNLMKSYDVAGNERPHLRNLKRKLLECGLNEGITNEVIDTLRIPDHPFLEKSNAFVFIRRWNGEPEKALATAENTANEAATLRTHGRKAAVSLADVLDHFNSDLLAQMYREARQRAPYAGFDSIVELSQGIPRNLLGILAHIYRRALFAGESPFNGGKISLLSQTLGVIEGAKAFWNDAQPETDASDVREALEGLALLFRSIRFSDAPSECDICTFSIDLDKLTDASRAALRTAENWSHLIRIPQGAKGKNHRTIDEKFQFSPMLSPIWELSQHRRGAIELKPDLANAIFDRSLRTNLVKLVQARVASMYTPRIWRRSNEQKTML